MTSLVWGLWEEASGMSDQIAEKALARMSRMGLPPLTTTEGLALFDAALAAGRPVIVPARIDTTALRAQVEAGTLSPILRGLSGTSRRRSATNDPGVPAVEPSAALVERLLQQAESERRDTLLRLIRTNTAMVLGHSDEGQIEVEHAFKDLGIDSLTAVQLRNRLNSATGLALPTTVVFDHPTPAALTEHLTEELLSSAGNDARAGLIGKISELESAIDASGLSDEQHATITTRLENLLQKWHSQSQRAIDADATDDLDSATDEELFEALDNELQSFELD